MGRCERYGALSATTTELREKVATGSRILAKLGLSDYLGHVSARVPGSDNVLIKGRGAEVGNMLNTGPEHVVLVDIEGSPLEEGIRPPDEVVLHTEIYRARPDVMSVVHTHQATASAFGIAGKPILPMQGVMATVLVRPLAVYESSRKIVTRGNKERTWPWHSVIAWVSICATTVSS